MPRGPEENPTEPPPRADTEPRLRRASGVWLLPLACVVVFLMALVPYHWHDIWHHVRCGWYAFHHGPGVTDPFSCVGVQQGLRWIQYEWLFQVLAWFSHTRFGADGTVILKALVCAAAFLFVALACRARGAGWEPAAVAACLAALAAGPRFAARPDIVSFLAFGFVAWTLERSRNGRGGLLWALPPAFALWANMHGAFVAGWVVVGVAFLDGLARFSRAEEAEKPDAIRALCRLGFVLLLCVAAAFLNPYGWRIFLVPLKFARAPIIRRAVTEWAAPDLGFWLQPYALFAPILLLACALRPRRLRAADWVAVVLFSGLALSAQRHLSVLAIVTAPILAWQLEPVFARLRRRPVVARVGQALAACLCVLTLPVLRGPTLGTLGVGVTPGIYAEMAADYLEEENIEGNLFNDYDDGNYLMWRRYPHNLVFVDARLDVYGDDGMRIFDDVWGAYPPGTKVKDYGGWRVAEGWRNVLDRFEVRACVARYVLTEAEALFRPKVRIVTEDGATVEGAGIDTDTQPLVDALWRDPDWALVFWDDRRAIFLRREAVEGRYVYKTRPDLWRPENMRDASLRRQTLRDLEHRIALGERFDCVAARVLMANTLRLDDRHEEAVPHLRRAFELRPRNADRAYDLAVGLRHVGQTEEAAEVFRKAIDLPGKRKHRAWNGLGDCLRAMGRNEEAVRCFRRALAIEPDYLYAWLGLSAAYETLGQKDDAVGAAEKALRIAPENAVAKEALDRIR